MIQAFGFIRYMGMLVMEDDKMLIQIALRQRQWISVTYSPRAMWRSDTKGWSNGHAGTLLHRRSRGRPA